MTSLHLLYVGSLADVVPDEAEEILRQERVLQAVSRAFDGGRNLLSELIRGHLVHELSRQFGVEVRGSGPAGLMSSLGLSFIVLMS